MQQTSKSNKESAKIQNHYFVVVLVSLLFTTCMYILQEAIHFFPNIERTTKHSQCQFDATLLLFVTQDFFSKPHYALFFHLQIKPKVKNLLAVVHFQKVFKEKFQRDIFLTTVQLQMHLLRMCKTRGAIFKLVCHDQSISGSQKTLWKTKQKLHFNTLSGGF